VLAVLAGHPGSTAYQIGQGIPGNPALSVLHPLLRRLGKTGQVRFTADTRGERYYLTDQYYREQETERE
jgi:hypothetical protein